MNSLNGFLFDKRMLSISPAARIRRVMIRSFVYGTTRNACSVSFLTLVTGCESPHLIPTFHSAILAQAGIYKEYWCTQSSRSLISSISAQRT